MRTSRWSWVDGWQDRFARSYFEWLSPSAETVLCFWLVLTTAAWLSSQDVFDYVTTQSNGRHDTPASLSQAALGAAFPKLVWDHAVVSIRCRSGCDVFNTEVQEFAERLSEELDAYSPHGIFDAPISLFAVLPAGSDVSAGAADVELRRSVEMLRQKALHVEQARLRANGSAAGMPLPVNTSNAAALLARANMLLRNASRSKVARDELLERVRRAGAAFRMGLHSGSRMKGGSEISPELENSSSLLAASLLGANFTSDAILIHATNAFAEGLRESVAPEPVSYTDLTLPTTPYV